LWLMTALGQSRRFRHVGGMSGFGGNIGSADTDYESGSRKKLADPYKSTTT
jgi:hypothetical protein